MASHKNIDMLVELVSGEKKVDRGVPCDLDYPERFFAAVMFAACPPPNIKMDDQDRLCLYALFQQVTEGPNTTSRPWGVFASVVEQAKWDAWTHLGQMTPNEAARLYVSTMQGLCPAWWQILSEGGSPNKVKWIKAEVSDMSELYKDKVLAEQIDQVKLKMEREVSHLERKLQQQDTLKEMGEVLSEVEKASDIVPAAEKELLKLAVAEVKRSVQRQMQNDVLLDVVDGVSDAEDPGYQERLAADAKALHAMVNKDCPRVNAKKDDFLAKDGDFVPCKFDQDQELEQADFEPVVAERLPHLLGQESFTTARTPVHRKRGMKGNLAKAASQAGSKNNLEGYMENVLTLFSGRREVEPSEVPPPANLLEPDVDMDMEVFESLRETQRTVETKLRSMAEQSEAACEVLQPDYLEKLSARLDAYTAADLQAMATKAIEEEQEIKAERAAQKAETEERMAKFLNKRKEGMDELIELEKALETEEQTTPMFQSDRARKAQEMLDSMDAPPILEMAEPEDKSAVLKVVDPYTLAKTVHDKITMRDLHAVDAPDKWTVLDTMGEAPLGRHEHAAVLVNRTMLVMGGRRSGRLMDDIQALNLESLKWTKWRVEYMDAADVPPNCAGHQMVLVNKKVVVIGGLSSELEDEPIAIRLLDPETKFWSRPPAVGGAVPLARAGFAMCKLASVLWLFGGEDKNRNVLNEVVCFDTEKLTWQRFERSMVHNPQDGIPALAYHTAVGYETRWIILFGGMDADMTCSGELYVLDLDHMKWVKPTVLGEAPFARAGHVATLLGNRMYIVGGGDGCRAVTATQCLNLSKIQRGIVSWEPVCGSVVQRCTYLDNQRTMTKMVPTDYTETRNPISTEGLSCIALPSRDGGSLLCFGGSDGNFYNDVLLMSPQVLRDTNTLQSHQAAYVGCSTAGLADIKLSVNVSKGVGTLSDDLHAGRLGTAKDVAETVALEAGREIPINGVAETQWTER